MSLLFLNLLVFCLSGNLVYANQFTSTKKAIAVPIDEAFWNEDKENSEVCEDCYKPNLYGIGLATPKASNGKSTAGRLHDLSDRALNFTPSFLFNPQEKIAFKNYLDILGGKKYSIDEEVGGENTGLNSYFSSMWGKSKVSNLDNVRKRASPKGLPTRPLCVMRFRSWK
jgi:hypothetical protein